jgi:hypothetical protein
MKDMYSDNRGGHSKFVDLYCENCGVHVLLYQKDGPGPLKRLYLDRILAPSEFTSLQSVEKLPDLYCKTCNRLLAIPYVYERENRRSYALLAYVTVDKKGKGGYPPKRLSLGK